MEGSNRLLFRSLPSCYLSMSPEIQHLSKNKRNFHCLTTKTLKLLSTLYYHKRNPVPFFIISEKQGKHSFSAVNQLEDGGHVNAAKTVRDLHQLICMISRLKLLKR